MKLGRGDSLVGLVVLALAGWLGAGCGTSDGEPTVAAQAELGEGFAEPPLTSLHTVAVPRPTGGTIVDQAAAVRLGKAFFWDMQAGGDGMQSCASCHFHAGTDNRRLNTMHPGDNGRFESNGVTGPGQMAGTVNVSQDDRVGSQGVTWGKFVGISSDPAVAADVCTAHAPEAPFMAERRVTARNTPSVIGAVFYREAFWDGRANHTFNGQNPFGLGGNSSVEPLAQIEHGSLASQATGPAGDAVEMTCEGRPLNGAQSLGSKLMARVPLQLQMVDASDSVLGALSAAPGTGLRCGGAPCSYRDLVAAAFGPAVAAQAEQRFSQIWGEAIQAYESTLIPDQTPLDRFLEGDLNALSAQQQAGFMLFRMSARCMQCHAGPELSDASVGFSERHGLLNTDGGDQGFHHIGVRPASALHADDIGRAGKGPGGVSYSKSGALPDRGAMKTPSLRNVKLTAPYFHNGSKATLGDVLDFYEKGGDFPGSASQLHAITLLPTERASLLDFLENALTDCRVEMEKAPFDHPSLTVPNGPALAAVGATGLGPCASTAPVTPTTPNKVGIPNL
jgi:cytochrome c peroxidase